MKTVTLNPSAAGYDWPEDLRSWFEDRELVELALDAVQTVTMQSASFSLKRFEEINPQMLLTLLTYCYAAGIYDSESIEWAAEQDETVRYICACTNPDWQVIRRFRKTHRQWVERSLAYLLNQAATRRSAKTVRRSSLGSMFALSYLAAFVCARRKVELAIMMDTAASD